MPRLAPPTAQVSADSVQVDNTGVENRLDQIKAMVDQLEGYVDQTEPLLTAIRDYVDTLETLLGGNLNVTVSNPTNVSALARESTLAALVPLLDGVEGLLTQIRDAADSAFKRLLKFEPSAGEEIRREETLTDDYHGAAPDGTLTSAAAWRVARFYKQAGQIVRVRYRTNVVWNDRTLGW